MQIIFSVSNLCFFQIAAFIAEPVIGSGGVILPPATYFDKVSSHFLYEFETCSYFLLYLDAYS